MGSHLLQCISPELSVHKEERGGGWNQTVCTLNVTTWCHVLPPLSASHVHKVKVHSFIIQWQKHISKKQYITSFVCEMRVLFLLSNWEIFITRQSYCSSFILVKMSLIVYRQELPPPRHFFRICHFHCPHHCMMTAARNQKISDPPIPNLYH